MPKELYAHVPMTGDQLDVVAAALVLYAATMRRMSIVGDASSSAAIADELYRQIALARRDVR